MLRNIYPFQISCLWSPIALNPDLPTSIQNIGLLSWRSRGVSEFGHLFDDGQMRSFQELRLEFNLSSKDFYKFLQIRHFLELQLKEGNIQLDLTEIEKLLFSSFTLKKKVSELYTMLFNVGASSFDSLRVIWEKDIVLAMRSGYLSVQISSPKVLQFRFTNKIINFFTGFI